MKPISPKDLADNKLRTLPEYVIRAFNDLITEKFDDGSAVILQKEAVARIKTLNRDISSEEIFNLGYLNVEAIFRKAGWKVEYDKPAYNEDYEPTFIFSKI
jgi:hypothetical protein